MIPPMPLLQYLRHMKGRTSPVLARGRYTVMRRSNGDVISAWSSADRIA
jgi:hypothetical protein